MPPQRLDRAPPNGRNRRGDGPRWRARRALVLGATGALAVAVTGLLVAALSPHPWSVAKVVLVLVFGVTTAWLALAFVTAAVGLAATLASCRGVAEPAARSLGQPSSRTAVLVPVRHEDPEALSYRLRELIDGLGGLGVIAHFDVFVLSDSTDPAVVLRERAALAALLRRRPRAPLYYRHRVRPVGRKAGNIAQWCRRWGGGYEHMVVLDADSVMRAATLLYLTLAMERNPRAGLMQTVPTLLPGRTLFGRMQSFAAQLQAPVIGRGLAFWYGASGNYWGHNAIVRVRAFCAAARLPRLPGRAPLGGEILSHDFVEAALLRRAGWEVHLLPGLGGSHEGSPQTLREFALRDRRWCQGNLQHARVLPARGLPGMSRLHLLAGIASYAAAPCWLLMLLLTAMLLSQPGGSGLGLVVAALLVLLLGVKVCALVSVAVRPELRARWVPVAVSAVAETLLVALLAPLHMLAQCRACAEVLLLRRDAGWCAQRCPRTGGCARDEVIHHLPYSAAAVLLASALLALDALSAWLAPVLAAAALAPFLALLMGSARLGALSARIGLFAVPEPHARLRRASAQPPVPRRRLRSGSVRGAYTGCRLSQAQGRPRMLA